MEVCLLMVEKATFGGLLRLLHFGSIRLIIGIIHVYRMLCNPATNNVFLKHVYFPRSPFKELSIYIWIVTGPLNLIGSNFHRFKESQFSYKTSH